MKGSAENLTEARTDRRDLKSNRRESENTEPVASERRVRERREKRFDRRSENNLLFSTFYIGESLFGIPVERVREIQPSQAMTPVPLAGDHYSGLINLRGQIVPAIDLEQLIYNKKIDPGSIHFNIFVHIKSEVFSFVVGKIGDVLEVYKHLAEPPPPNLEPGLARYVDSVCKLDDSLVVILDVERLPV